MQSRSPLRENKPKRHQALPDESSASWRYQPSGHIGGLRFSGVVNVTTDCEALCVHAELADVLYDLLVWAHTARHTAAQPSLANGVGSAA